jgi:hypothetical protein
MVDAALATPDPRATWRARAWRTKSAKAMLVSLPSAKRSFTVPPSNPTI